MGERATRARKESGAKTQSHLKGSRRQRVETLLSEIEKRLHIEKSKVTLGDFIRLMQLERELEEEEQPREIIVTWKDPAEKRCELK